MKFESGQRVWCHFINIDGCCGSGDIIGEVTFLSESNGMARILVKKHGYDTEKEVYSHYLKELD